MKTFSIIENGNQIDITEAERDILVRDKIIYHCPDCGEVFYHVIGGKMGFEEIDELLSKQQ